MRRAQVIALLFLLGLAPCATGQSYRADLGAVRADGAFSLAYSNLTGIAASRLIGRGSSGGTGAAQEITLGTGLSMTGTTLSVAVGSPETLTSNANSEVPLTIVGKGGTAATGPLLIAASLHQGWATSDDHGATWSVIADHATWCEYPNHGVSAYNGTRWIAGSDGCANTLAYSDDNGVTWTGLGTTTFGSEVWRVIWDGAKWVGCGKGSKIATSADGATWTPVSVSPFSTSCRDIAYNGSQYVAVGIGTNSIAYSANGTDWTGLGTTTFPSGGYAVTWGASKWVALGGGTNTIAHSANGTDWTGQGATVFSSGGYGIAWSGARFVAVGYGTNTMAWSDNGTDWTGLGTTPFSSIGRDVIWDGTYFVAGGTTTSDGNATVYRSTNGTSWTASANLTGFGNRMARLGGAPQPTLSPAVPGIPAPASTQTASLQEWKDGTGTVVASVAADGTLTAPGFALSALNAAPASATDTCTAGEIRITAAHIYVCVATDTWVRAPLATWP